MTTTVSRRFDTREREDDCGSETSTLKGSFLNAGSIASSRTFVRLGYVNSATSIISKKDIYVSEKCSSDSDEANFNESDDDEEETTDQEPFKQPSITKTSRIDDSPEAEKKRKEAYEKWLNSVTAREKERKRLAKERLQAEIEAELKLQEQRKQKSEEKVEKWLKKKQIEGEKKIARLLEMKRAAAAANTKPKEFKKAINFEEWMSKKNDDLLALKIKQEEKKKATKTVQKVRESVSTASYEKWSRKASSKAKPVPFNKGLASLSGSTTKIYINPEPWKFDE